MSLARAFTTRRVKQSIQVAEEKKANARSNSVRGSVGTLRHKISSPVELIHTTNMLSYNAPDINPMSASSTGSSHRSDDDMSMSDSALTNGTTPPTSPDVESPAKRSRSPEPNHLSCFFSVAPVQQQTPGPAARPEAQVLPQRTTSHSSKKQYNTLVRKQSASGLSQQSQRTVSTKASFTFSRSSSTSTSTSVSSTPAHHHQHKPKLPSTASPAPAPTPASPPRQQPPPRQRSNSNSSSGRRDLSESSQQQQPHHHQHQHHPFGNELAQVSELAEEYGVQEQMVDVAEREEKAMLQKGLLKFSADEYMSDVRALFASFMVPPRPVAAAWI
ncbi:hypothetical protein F5144DRAFT_190661 [Chaetomium tenue]|uniref:Uncharacterized protein n=1 Tax=Chaetomium tenue TaxID=1854479 RepID=A0ACB7PEG2_9PEZI|nr:hypothetical protein F5144DRAFT_190661 [Chaetomium globosum]